MLVHFTFTDSPRGSSQLHILEGVVYEIYDHEGNLILINETGIEDLQPGKYCIYATKPLESDFEVFAHSYIYYGEEPFIVTDVPPPWPPIFPPPEWDINITVYMTEIPRELKIPTSCPELWHEPSEPDGEFPWLLLLIIGALIITGEEAYRRRRK